MVLPLIGPKERLKKVIKELRAEGVRPDPISIRGRTADNKNIAWTIVSRDELAGRGATGRGPRCRSAPPLGESFGAATQHRQLRQSAVAPPLQGVAAWTRAGRGRMTARTPRLGAMSRSSLSSRPHDRKRTASGAEEEEEQQQQQQQAESEGEEARLASGCEAIFTRPWSFMCDSPYKASMGGRRARR